MSVGAQPRTCFQWGSLYGPTLITITTSHLPCPMSSDRWDAFVMASDHIFNIRCTCDHRPQGLNLFSVCSHSLHTLLLSLARSLHLSLPLSLSLSETETQTCVGLARIYLPSNSCQIPSLKHYFIIQQSLCKIILAFSPNACSITLDASTSAVFATLAIYGDPYMS